MSKLEKETQKTSKFLTIFLKKIEGATFTATT